MNNRLTLNYILFLVLSFLIIFGYTSYVAKNTKKTKKVENKEKVSDVVVTNESKPIEKETLKFNELKNSSEGKLINIDTPLYSAIIDTVGGRFKEFKLKKYKETTEPNSELVNLISESNQLITSIEVKGKQIPLLIPYSYSGINNINIENSNKEILLTYVDGSGVKINKKLIFNPNSYVINENIDLENTSGEQIDYNTKFLAFGTAKTIGSTFSPVNSKSFVLLTNDEFEKIDKSPSEQKLFSGQINWFGFSDKYFLTSVLPEIGVSNSVVLNPTSEKDILSAQYSYPSESVKSGNKHTRKWKLYFGPKEDKRLAEVGYNLDKAVDYGFLEFLSKIGLKFLKALNSIFNNYGISIIVITLIIRLLFLPLTLKSMRSMKEMQNKMQIIKPKIDALKEKYKDDKATQNSELMKLYSSHGVNPLSSLGGCFPMLIQMPVFLALYYVLLYAIDLRHSSFLWVADLSEPEHLFDIPLLGDFSIPFRILPLLMGVSWFLSTKLTPPSAAPTSESMELQMKMMQYMPVIFTVMFWGLPSGLILYWSVSNILSIGQQLYINRSVSAAKGG